MSGASIVVVGIGADGWEGLTQPARDAIMAADEVIGSPRQMESLPKDTPPKRLWPSPMAPAIDELAGRRQGHFAVVASGDPMLHGIGASLAAKVAPERLTVIPHVSSFSLACARLRWPAAEVELVSAVARPAEVFARALQPGRRIVGLVTGGDGAASVARVLREQGLGDSRFVVMEQLGSAEERLTDTTAEQWGVRAADPLHVVAIECRPPRSGALYPRVPGLPDDAYEHDAALTKRHVRAATVAALAPGPGELLWDIGAGSGSIAIEWLRAEAAARAVAVEQREDRAARIARNALALGVPDRLHVVVGDAPGALEALERPDAIFVGGGLTAPGMLDRCRAALKPSGRLVANAVTLEGERVLEDAWLEHGGDLTRLETSHAEPLGSFSAWRPQLPIVQWEVRL
ncbi:MAG: precorrin-6y C5,15-methyltransferase (decarboxylating) subunit CbiE [Solirubrobacteraceae bacterium]